ncbi:ephexin-1-like isoform X1 [Astyanax mexicanus]|uniref:Ephexin-1-like isoform X1 n=1 Tax=Astyanax mexicanus TaxID=7994 RepID=A0A8T2M3X5_ASTMX|nr:ephexin-1-like isoform X1 [Astyanax mexicanus]
MGTDKGIIFKPQLLPKPNLRGGKWHSSINTIQKVEAEEADHQIQIRQWGENGLDTPPQSKPIPRPRLHKPRLLQNTSSRPDEDDPSTSSSPASDYSSESDMIPSACPLSCPCVCHCHASKHGSIHGQHDLHQSETSDYTDREYYNHQLDTWSIKHHQKPRRVPPNVPVPPRPLPKKPHRIITADEVETTDRNIMNGVYVDIDVKSQALALAHSQPGNECEYTYFEETSPPSKPVPAVRTRHKDQFPSQRPTKHLDTDRVILDSLKSELCRILSSENQENAENIPKPRAMKNAFVKFTHQVFSKSMSQSPSKQKRVQLDLDQSENKKHTNEGDQDNGIPAEDAPRPVKPKKSSIKDKSEPVIEQIIRNLSISKPSKIWKLAKSPEPPPIAPEEQDTEDHSQIKSNQRDNNKSSSGLLERFWHERSLVKDSGILDQFTKEEILLQESMYEVVITEQSYLDGLAVAVEHFQECAELKSAMEPRDQKALFSGISKIREISQTFMDAMVQKLESSLLCNAVCDVVHHYASGPFGVYVDYIRNMPYQKQTLANLRNESAEVVEILCKLQDNPCCNRLPLDSFLSLPFQRIPRLKILMETVVKRTGLASDVRVIAERALKEISKVVEECNREVDKMKKMEELVLTANKIEFEYKAVALVSSARWLVREGDVVQLSVKENIFGQKKICPLHLFLFNDLLLLATRKGSDRFVVQDHVHRSLVEVTAGAELDEDLDGCDLSRVFQLDLVKNHRGTLSQYLLQTSTQEQRDSWLDVLSNQKSEEETVYEEWDCPQVRCIQVYQAQHPGELSLQRDELLNIIQKTTDGYMEGQRLQDGQRGWFPAFCVEEISTEHVQRRHLRERYRVLQAADRILKRYNTTKNCQTNICFK